MRTLSAPMLTGIAAHITEPVYLVEVLLAQPFRWTTSDALSWNGYSWQPIGMEIEEIGETAARLQLRNDNNSGSALVLNNKLRDTEIRIYLYYNGDAVEIFRGYGSDSSVAAMTVSIDILAHRSANALAPRKRLASPLFTRLPKLGEVIKWGTESYQVTF
jgi:hypothetical protein